MVELRQCCVCPRLRAANFRTHGRITRHHQRQFRPVHRRICMMHARTSIESSSEDAWRESGWAEEEQESMRQNFPDVSLLTSGEREMVLGILPTTDQIRYMKDGGINQSVLWGVSLLIFFLASSREPYLGIAGGMFPLYESILRAAYRNVRVKTSSAQYIGIWHAEVLSMGLEQGYPGTDQVRSSLKLLIGEPGPAGFTSDMQVPWVPGCEKLRVSDQVEVLVMSKEPYFEEFQAVRDIYVPSEGLWLSDYPFLRRDVFERLSEDMYWSRQEGEPG